MLDPKKIEGYVYLRKTIVALLCEGAYLFHRTSCSSFCLKSFVFNGRKALAAIPFFYGECVNLTISQHQLQLFIKYSKSFRRAFVDIWTGKGGLGTATFSKELFVWSTYSLNFLSGYCSFLEQLLLTGFIWSIKIL